MTVTLELPAEVEQVLAARAHERGVSLSEYLLEVFRREVAAPESPRLNGGRGDAPKSQLLPTIEERLAALESLGRYNTRAEMGLEPSPDDDVALLYFEREDAQR